jgi:NAD(P)-dependent dehydrogenase (short-subunit alcohol dehydrogenase family)
LVDIDESNLRASASAAEKFDSKAVVAVCDRSQTAQVTAAVNACRGTFGGLDILVNSAGIVHYGPADEMSAERWNAVMSVNLLAPIQLVRELLPSMTEQNESHILNVCSILGLAPGRKLMAYQTSKFALVGLSLALRTEIGAQNVGVTAFAPVSSKRR